MDAEDILMARERIALAERRLAELIAQGVDTADLASQVAFARGALDQGRTLDVLAICEEVLLSAKRLSRPATMAPKPEGTSDPRPEATQRYPSGVYATPGAEALDRQRLTEEIRQVVHGDLMPKALTPAQLNERIEKMVDKAFKARAGKLEAEIDERFQRLTADPDTRTFAKDDAGHSSDAVAELEARLEARTAGIAKQSAQAISEATATLEQRLAELADPERLRTAIATAIDHRIGEGLAQLDLQHQESAARRAVSGADSAVRTDETLAKLTATIASLDGSLAVRIAAAVDERLPTAIAQATAGLAARLEDLADPLRLAQTVGQAVESTLAMHLAKRDLEQDESTTGMPPVFDPALLSQVSHAVASLESSLPERIAAAIDARLPLASSQAPVADTAPEPVNVPGMIAGLGKELRDDLAWQVEKLAAERGWISISDMQAELSRSGGNPASGGSAGFARLEAALVEFVHQTQSQQQQFLAVLQQKVESGTAIVAQQLLRQRSGSETFVVADQASARAPNPENHAALEAIAPASAAEPNLDVLSQSAQFRAITTLGDPTRPATATFLPGTQVTRRAPAPEPRGEPLPQPPTTRRSTLAADPETDATEVMEATEPTTVAQANPAADTTLDDLPTTANDALTELDTEVMELKPLSGIRTPITVERAIEEASGARPTAISAGGTGALARTTATSVTPPPTGAGHAETHRETAMTASAQAPTRVTVRSSGVFPSTARSTAASPTAAATGSTTSPGSGSGPSTGSGTGTVRMTGRVAALEASLRLLVQREVTAQMGRSTTDNNISHSGLQPSEAATGVPSALAPHGPHHLRDEVLHALRDPAIRQQILGVVAVEALANPGALGELTGLRAFIRDEIRKAGSMASTADDAEITPAAIAPAGL